MPIQPYIDTLVANTCDNITAFVHKQGEGNIANNLDRYLQGASFDFQKYYFRTLSNKSLPPNRDPVIINEFKKQYSLQGIDSATLKHWEDNKTQMIGMVRSDKIAELYIHYFHGVDTKHGEGKKKKNFGSAFSKFVHTYDPENYCPLDNPIRSLLGLEKESFYVAFLVASKAYRKWADDNPAHLSTFRKAFQDADTNKHLPHDRIADMKMMDMVFWGIMPAGDKPQAA